MFTDQNGRDQKPAEDKKDVDGRSAAPEIRNPAVGAENDAHGNGPQPIQTRIVDVFHGKDAETASDSSKLNHDSAVAVIVRCAVLFAFINAKPRNRLASALTEPF